MSQHSYEIYQRPSRPVSEQGPRPAAAEPARRTHGGACWSADSDAGSRFLLASGICVAIWLMTGAGYFWPMWVMLGTGIPALLSLGRRHA